MAKTPKTLKPVLEVKSDRRYKNEPKDRIQAFSTHHKTRPWCVEVRQAGNRLRSFYEDTFDAADAIIKDAGRLLMAHRLPVEEGLRRIQRLADYMDDRSGK